MLRIVSFGVVLVALSQPVLAADVALNASVIEVAGLPGPTHVALYPGVALSLAIEVPYFLLLPSLGVEWAPEISSGGLVAMLVADHSVTNWLGVDLCAMVTQDQPGWRVKDSVFYLGAGPGLSFIFGSWVASTSVLASYGLRDRTWSLVPGVNVARTLSL